MQVHFNAVHKLDLSPSPINEMMVLTVRFCSVSSPARELHPALQGVPAAPDRVGRVRDYVADAADEAAGTGLAAAPGGDREGARTPSHDVRRQRAATLDSQAGHASGSHGYVRLLGCLAREA